MIYLVSQTAADKEGIHPGRVQNISPYLNPAHVLAPPRGWIEALLRGEYSWHFFRLRYKNMLRLRFRGDPERFFSILDASADDRPLYLACHCLAGPCHRDVAADFLEKLRLQEPYRNRQALRAAAFAAHAHPAFPAVWAAGRG